MIWVFVMVFSLTIVALTTTQSVVLALYAIVPCFIIVLLFAIIRKQLLSYMMLAFLWLMLGFISIGIFISHYNKNIFPVWQAIINTNDAGYTILIATGTIQEKQTHNRYIRQSDNGALFFLYSDRQYIPWDYIRLTANAQPTTRQKLSLFIDHHNKKHRFIDYRKNYRFDFQTRQIMKWVAGSLRERNSIILWQTELKPLPSIKTNIQQRINTTFTTNSQRWLVAGMLLGDRSLLPQDDYQLFIDSGIVHIIAVSGAHIVTLVLFLQLLLFFLPFYFRIAIIIPCIIGYGALCWLDGSVLRAVIMGTLSLLALFRWKQTVVWRSLLIAYVIMLLINPFFLVYDIGFVFSFSAVIGIVYMGSWSKNWIFSHTKITRPINYILTSYIYPSLGASMMIAPFLLFFTGKFNLIAILANIFIFPFIPIVMIGWAITTLLMHTWIGSLLYTIISHGIEYLYFIAILGQKYAVYIVSHSQWFMYIFIAIIILLISVDRLNICNRPIYPTNRVP
jgi:ComEC/Rec2-related protein